jgi:hypothetical protein
LNGAVTGIENHLVTNLRGVGENINFVEVTPSLLKLGMDMSVQAATALHLTRGFIVHSKGNKKKKGLIEGLSGEL